MSLSLIANREEGVEPQVVDGDELLLCAVYAEAYLALILPLVLSLPLQARISVREAQAFLERGLHSVGRLTMDEERRQGEERLKLEGARG